MIKIAPSILAADFAQLGNEIETVKSADYLHFDVMDGVFVPNISFGTPVLKSIRKITSMTLDIHLMISEPSKHMALFADAGADIIVFHIEAETKDNALKAIRELRSKGKKAGLSIKPATPAKEIMPFLELIDVALVMTVEPGFGGQAFMAAMLPKIAELREEIDKSGLKCEIEVDGGINAETAKLCAKAGASIMVAGSDVFLSSDRAGKIAELRTVL